jgi:hypothetical protein
LEKKGQRNGKILEYKKYKGRKILIQGLESYRWKNVGEKGDSIKKR